MSRKYVLSERPRAKDRRLFYTLKETLPANHKFPRANRHISDSCLQHIIILTLVT